MKEGLRKDVYVAIFVDDEGIKQKRRIWCDDKGVEYIKFDNRLYKLEDIKKKYDVRTCFGSCSTKKKNRNWYWDECF